MRQFLTSQYIFQAIKSSLPIVLLLQLQPINVRHVTYSCRRKRSWNIDMWAFSVSSRAKALGSAIPLRNVNRQLTVKRLTPSKFRSGLDINSAAPFPRYSLPLSVSSLSKIDLKLSSRRSMQLLVKKFPLLFGSNRKRQTRRFPVAGE